MFFLFRARVPSVSQSFHFHKTQNRRRLGWGSSSKRVQVGFWVAAVETRTRNAFDAKKTVSSTEVSYVRSRHVPGGLICHLF